MKTELAKRPISIITDKHFSLDQTGLIVQGNPSYEDWAKFGQLLTQVEGSIHWWIGDWVNYGESAYGEKYSQAIEDTGFTYDTVRHDADASRIFEIGRRRPNLSFSHHKDVMWLPTKEQDQLLNKAEKENWTRVQLRAAKRTKANLLPLPKGKYKTIIIDPPWPIEKIEREVAPKQHKDLDYQTMEIDEIQKLPIPADLAGCNVFMWTTHKYLPDALRIFEGWGVKYICTMVWHKNGGFQPFNLPQYNCEFVVFGRIGTVEFETTKDFMCCFSAKRSGHSVKPECFYDTIARVSPKSRLAMFERKKRSGFDIWGLEI